MVSDMFFFFPDLLAARTGGNIHRHFPRKWCLESEFLQPITGYVDRQEEKVRSCKEATKDDEAVQDSRISFEKGWVHC